jgi:hypothetical protein
MGRKKAKIARAILDFIANEIGDAVTFERDDKIVARWDGGKYGVILKVEEVWYNGGHGRSGSAKGVRGSRQGHAEGSRPANHDEAPVPVSDERA